MGFTLASNVYTTVADLVDERVWDRIRWCRRIFARNEGALGAAAV